MFRQFFKHKLGGCALVVVCLFCLVGIYAPFLASSRPLIAIYNKEWYFPLFRYLFYPGFFTKRIDIFFNLAAVIFPFVILGRLLLKGKKLLYSLSALFSLQMVGFFFLIAFPLQDPASDPALNEQRQQALSCLRGSEKFPTWKFDLKYMTAYAKLNQILRYRQRKQQHERLAYYAKEEQKPLPTLWQIDKEHQRRRYERYYATIERHQKETSLGTKMYQEAVCLLTYEKQKTEWLRQQNEKISFVLMPLIRPYHWEDDVGGEQSMNQILPWWELSRINRKDLVAGLIFGVRISLVVGALAVILAMLIGIPIGSIAGYYGGRFDIILCRLLEIWESMPMFFMLLFVVSVIQSKSIFLVISVIGAFGWTGFARYIRAEFFKQRNLPYVEASFSQGFHDSYIMFSDILPNAFAPVLTLLPFAIMGAITTEAALSFLGLGEEGTCSWGVLMDEGRSVFPGESNLLWPPAILLTVLLVAIALVGDALRDALDPKLRET